MSGVLMLLKRSLIAAAVLAATGLATMQTSSAQPKLEVDRTFGNVRGWTVGLSESLGGCVAYATYQDETTVWLGFGGGESVEPFVAFTNPKWKSIQEGAEYRLRLSVRGQGNWNGTFTGVARAGERGIFNSGVKREFLFDIARSPGFNILLDRTSIAQLSLSGSAAALEAAIGCHKSYVEASNRAGPGPRTATPAAPSRGDKISTGTGFFVSKTGHVLTNEHVIKGCSEFQVSRTGAPATSARLVASDAANDLALLQTDATPGPVPPISVRARIGENVYVYGFPLAGTLASSGNFTVGHVSATAGLNDDTRKLQISAPVQPGNSGGPLIDQFGNVVGVIVSQLRGTAQNVNFAIKSTIALNFLDANRIEPSLDVATTALEPAKVAEQALSFTVQVICR
jgi:S1-C subfamily serine protease